MGTMRAALLLCFLRQYAADDALPPVEISEIAEVPELETVECNQRDVRYQTAGLDGNGCEHRVVSPRSSTPRVRRCGFANTRGHAAAWSPRAARGTNVPLNTRDAPHCYGASAAPDLYRVRWRLQQDGDQ